jgi:hypothetical protein
VLENGQKSNVEEPETLRARSTDRGRIVFRYRSMTGASQVWQEANRRNIKATLRFINLALRVVLSADQ